MRLTKNTFRVLLFVSFTVGLLLFGLSSLLFADQKELMDEWLKHKRQITDKIVTKLRQEGKLPQYGTVEFTARVKPLSSGDLEIVIDNLKVYPRNETKSSDSGSISRGKVVGTTQDEEVARKFQEIFRPRTPAPYWTTGTIDIVGGTTKSVDIHVKKTGEEAEIAGKLGESPTAPSQTSGVSSGEGTEFSSGKDESRGEQKQETTGWWDKFWRWLTGKSEGGQ